MNEQTSKINLKPAPEAPKAAAPTQAPSAPPKGDPPLQGPSAQAAAPPVAAEEPKEFPLNALTVPRFRPVFASMGDSGNLWRATTPRDTPWEHALRDEFWASNADRMLMGDKIEVLCDGGDYFVELLVIDADSPGRGIPNKRVSVAELRHVDLSAARRIPLASEYRVEHRGDFLRWCVIRVADNYPVIEKAYTRDEADEKMRAFLRARGETKKRAA